MRDRGWARGVLPWTPHGGAEVIGASKSATIEEMLEEDWDFTVDLVLKGIFLSVKHEARAMSGGGAI